MDRLKELRIDRTEKGAGKSGGGLLIGLIAALVLAGAGAGFWWLHQGRTPTVTTAAVERVGGGGADGSTVLDASGYVTARREATVSSKVTGKIVEVLVEEGMRIEEGQLLARLDDSLVRRQLELAEAQLATARRSLEETRVRLAEAELGLRRSRELVAGEVASQADLDAAQAARDALAARLAVGREEVRVAERQVALREQELADTEIRAPFAGVAVSKDAQPGEMISPVSAGGGFTRTGITTLVDMESLEIEVDVNEAYINRVEDDQRVTAVLDAYPDWRIPGSVITTVPTADRQKATVQVRIAFDQLDPRILPDMGVKVSFLAEEDEAEPAAEKPPVLVVPAAAVRDLDGQQVVFVVTGGMVEERAVRTGERRGEKVVVEAGVEAGERVVVEGPAELADGDEVEVAE